MTNKKDLAHKTNIINKLYLQEATIQKIISSFNNNKELPSISLINFFENNLFTILRKKILTLKTTPQKKPLQYSYAQSSLPKNLNLFFNHTELLSFISIIINQKVEEIELSYHIFTHKDYLLLHDSLQKKEHHDSCFDIIIDLTPKWDEHWGGIITYIDTLGNHHHLPCYNNTLTIIKREKNSQKYLKYINNNTKNNKKYLLMGRIITTN